MIEVKKGVMVIGSFILVLTILSSFASAGVGLKWGQEAKLVNQGEKTCFEYSVYNPWPKESYAKIDISDELKPILQLQESETKFIPANTNSSNSIPIKFCFEVPYVYSSERSCWIGNSFVCAQTCNEPQKVYDGEILATESGQANIGGGAGGSATSASVSAPLKIKVICSAHSRDFSQLFFILAVICAIIAIVMIIKKYRKPKVERDIERLKALKEQIRRERKGK